MPPSLKQIGHRKTRGGSLLHLHHIASQRSSNERIHESVSIIRPRLTDFHGIHLAQTEVDFAIPFLDEDIPLYVDPFLLWKSPSQQDQALHTSVTNSFNHLNYLLHRSKEREAKEILIEASECDEVGLGHSKRRKGLRIGERKADEVLNLFLHMDHYHRYGFTHFEEIQLYVQDVSRDRISDICCSFLKSFLIDYTMQECLQLDIPVEDTTIASVYDYRNNRFSRDERARLPLNPETREPLLFFPKRWLRYTPWIAFDDYFQHYCPQDEIFNPGETYDSIRVLSFNRHNYHVVKDYVSAKERTQQDCRNDPLFRQIPVLSAKRKYSSIQALQTGKTDGADRKYEDAVAQLLASLFYPHLDFASEQVRTDTGTQIRDLVFYNNREIPFLEEIFQDYGSRQLIFEMKNVRSIEREHISQLNRYLDSGLGKFGAFVTRNPPTRAMFRNTIDLWSGQRRCIVVLTDSDLELMVNLFESRQRDCIDVLKRAYVNFRRACPT